MDQAKNRPSRARFRSASNSAKILVFDQAETAESQAKSQTEGAANFSLPKMDNKETSAQPGMPDYNTIVY